MIRDLTDEEARRALVLKWGSVDPDVLPAWVAEMDYALAPPVAEALQRAVADGVTGYPAFVRRRRWARRTPGSHGATSGSRSTPSRCCRPWT